MTTLTLLALLCPGSSYLAPHVDEAARRYLVPVVELLALVKAENARCDPRGVNRRTGAVGLGQILPRGNANPRHLPVEKLKDPAINLMLTARHLRRMKRLCHSFGGAVHVYHGHRTCAGCKQDKHAHKVLRIAARARRQLEQRMKGMSK